MTEDERYDDELPVETDNGPRPEDGPQDDLPQEPGSEVG